MWLYLSSFLTERLELELAVLNGESFPSVSGVFESAKSGSDNVSSTIRNICLLFFTRSSHKFCNIKHKLQNIARSQAPKRTPTFNYYINHAERFNSIYTNISIDKGKKHANLHV